MNSPDQRSGVPDGAEAAQNRVRRDHHHGKREQLQQPNRQDPVGEGIGPGLRVAGQGISIPGWMGDCSESHEPRKTNASPTANLLTAPTGRRPRPEALIGGWDRPTAIAAWPDRERSGRDRGGRAGDGAQARPGPRYRSADRADGGQGDHLEARRSAHDPEHPPAHGRDPGALPHPRGVRNRGDRGRPRRLCPDSRRHGSRIRSGADRQGAAGWSARPRSGPRSPSAPPCSSLFAAASGPIEAFLGEPDVGTDGAGRRAHVRDLLDRLEQPGRVHARDALPRASSCAAG